MRNQEITFPLTDAPIGSGLTVTVPLRASSSTLADIVVLIGTPNLLFKLTKRWNHKRTSTTKLFCFHLMNQVDHLNRAANMVFTVPRFDKSISMSMPSASRA